MTESSSPKERAMFYLSRRIRELDNTTALPSHESLAHAGLSYEDRRAAVNTADTRRRVAELEMGALQYARDVVEKHG